MSYDNQSSYGGGGGGGGEYGRQGGSEYNTGGGNYGGREGGGEYAGGGGGQYGRQGGSEYNSGDQGGQGYGGGRQGQGGYGGGHQGGYNDNDNEFGGAMGHAQEHGGNSGDSSLFSSAFGFLSGNKHSIQNESIDESGMVGAHQAMYSNQGGQQQGNHSSETVGAGAAMQALKMFTGGQSGNTSGGGAGMGSGSMGGGASQNGFIGMAMGQASKLFDQQAQNGNLQSGADKQSAVNAAGKMALKMYLKSGSGGGMGALAGRFM